MRFNRRHKLIFGVILFCTILFFAFIGNNLTKADYVDGGEVYRPELETRQEFTINDEETYKMIGMRLEHEGLIENNNHFNQYIKSNGYQHRIRSGTFTLSPSMSLEEIVSNLISGKGAIRSFLIYDGANLEQIASVFSKKNVMSEDEFWYEVENGDFKNYTFISNPNGERTRLEGYLYPGQYSYREGMSHHDIICMMLDRFFSNYQSLIFSDTKLSIQETVNLASLIEKEAANDAEKPTIASVYINRLRIGQPLQCDATVVYGMTDKKERLSFSDYEVNSPYNTYKIKGLPPTPIASPGLTSLQAAANPAQTDYYYYLLNTDSYDRHVFASNYEEHLKNRKLYGYDG